MKKLPLVLLAGLLWGCASVDTEVEKTSEKVSPVVLSQLPVSTHLGGSDPLEGFNRTVFYGVDFFYYYLYRPVGYIYGSIMPRYGISLINNATGNLEFPRRFLSSVLQGKFGWAGTEFLRFITNSTIGIAGLFDPAKHWFDLHEHNEDFGQAFAAWGIGPGCVLQLAFSSNIRDGIGMAFDYVVDIKSYFYGGQAFTFLNRGLDAFAQYDAVRRSTFDSYQAFKDYQLLVRNYQVNNFQPEELYVELPETEKSAQGSGQVVKLNGFYPQSAEVDTLRSSWMRPAQTSMWSRLSFFNSDFANQAQTGSVEIAPEREIAYRYWLCQEDPQAPLVVILPGLGGHNTADTAQALAGLCVQNHLSALIVSNTMTWEFAEAFDSPMGYAPDDAAKLEQLLTLIMEQLSSDHPEYRPSCRMLMGYSQGALNALFMLDRQRRNQSKLEFAQVLAINPPVDMLKALGMLDSYMRSMDACSVDTAVPQLINAAGSYLTNSRQSAQIRKGRRTVWLEPAPGEKESRPAMADQVPVTQQEARILIAYSFKRSLEDLLVAMHHKQPVNGIKTPYQWGNRQALYDELAAWNYLAYCRNVLLPWYQQQKKDISLAELNKRAGMYALSDTLRQCSNLMVIHNADDFLLDDSDREFLRRQLGGKLVMFEHGGHLGNLYRREVQELIVNTLTRQLPKVPNRSEGGSQK